MLLNECGDVMRICKEQNGSVPCVPPFLPNWKARNGLWTMLGESNECKISVLALNPVSLDGGHVLVAEKLD